MPKRRRKTWIKCKACNGRGWYNLKGISKICTVCEGRGKVEEIPYGKG